jgi:hypothetical protein
MKPRLLDHGLHRPESHPLLRAKHEKLERLIQSDVAVARMVLSKAEEDASEITEGLEAIARIVARIPDSPFTIEQRRMAFVINTELQRLARSRGARDHAERYRRAAHEATERKYAAIADTVKEHPERGLADIAGEYGVSRQLVSRIAIVRGARRRIRTR